MKCEEGPVYNRANGHLLQDPILYNPPAQRRPRIAGLQINAVQYYTACASCGMPVVDEPCNLLLRTPPTILLYNRRGRRGGNGDDRMEHGSIQV